MVYPHMINHVVSIVNLEALGSTQGQAVAMTFKLGIQRCGVILGLARYQCSFTQQYSILNAN